MASSTKTIVKSSYANSYNVQVGEIVFDWTQVGDHSTVDYELIGQVKVPAHSYILDIQSHGIELWDAGDNVTLIIGDEDAADGFFASANLKATGELLVGEANTFEHPNGIAGTEYLASDKRGGYSASERTIIAKLTVADHATAVTTGKTRVLVMYCCPPVETVKP